MLRSEGPLRCRGPRHSTKRCDVSRQCVRLPGYFLIAPPTELRFISAMCPPSNIFPDCSHSIRTVRSFASPPRAQQPTYKESASLLWNREGLRRVRPEAYILQYIRVNDVQ